MLKDLRKYITSLEKEAIPQLSVNCVIMGFHERALKVVVNKVAVGETMLTLLPGGYVKQEEDLTDSVERIVKESTGLENILFRQFAIFGKASRSFAGELALKAGFQAGSDQILLDWLSKRFISLCYIALVDYRSIELNPTEYFDSAQWFPAERAEDLDMDHADILHSARQFLISQVPHIPVASNLLPHQFTLPELLALMEAILGRVIDRPNFRRKILRSGMLEKLGSKHTGRGRPADMYRFKNGKSTPLLDELKFGF